MQSCQHERTEFLYRRDGVDYVRCLGCGQVFEAEDLDTVPVYEDDDEEKPRASGIKKKPRVSGV